MNLISPAINGNVENSTRRFGKDELNLADWKIGVATYQQPVTDEGKKVDRHTTVISRSDGTCQQVIREAPSSVGLPTAADDDLLLALEYLTYREGFNADVIHFEPNELLKIMNCPANNHYRQRLKDSFERLVKVSVTYTDIWYDRKTQAVAPAFFTGVLAETKLVFRRGRPQQGSRPESYFQWVDSLFQSMKQGNLATIDLDLHFSLKLPGSRQLHRHLNKRRYGTRKYATYERDLKELACGHLGMQDCKDLKRNFHRSVQELIDVNYLSPDSVQYIKVRPGVWRVRFDFQAVSPVVPAPVALVQQFYKLWAGEVPPRIFDGELAHARELLDLHPETTIRQVLPNVVSTMKTEFPNAKSFGGARKYFDEALQSFSARQQKIERTEVDVQADTQKQAAFHEEQEQKRQLRGKRLAIWDELTEAQKSKLYEEAIQQATSAAVRARLVRGKADQHPATEVLALLVTKQNTPAGDSA
ncbi:replication initiator protein A [Gimesia aquarii]|uniref:Replication initiator protein A n=1 Tax=Gimesia aquarii TaxID=2527964 RepID=A0A517X052_9PLAN|nr:replication initiator protein A [Gimesia aquarii]QDU10877.1 Replication initiator protein A [Gimesia aquarii]